MWKTNERRGERTSGKNLIAANSFYDVLFMYPRIQFRRCCRRLHVVSQLDLWLEDCALVINRERFHTAISAGMKQCVELSESEKFHTASLQPFIMGIERVSFNDNKATLIFPILKILHESNLNSLLPPPMQLQSGWKNDFFEVLAAAAVGERKMVNGSE